MTNYDDRIPELIPILNPIPESIPQTDSGPTEPTYLIRNRFQRKHSFFPITRKNHHQTDTFPKTPN